MLAGRAQGWLVHSPESSIERRESRLPPQVRFSWLCLSWEMGIWSDASSSVCRASEAISVVSAICNQFCTMVGDNAFGSHTTFKDGEPNALQVVHSIWTQARQRWGRDSTISLGSCWSQCRSKTSSCSPAPQARDVTGRGSMRSAAHCHWQALKACKMACVVWLCSAYHRLAR